MKRYFNFCYALTELKLNSKVRRNPWPLNQYIYYLIKDRQIAFYTRAGDKFLWTPTQEEILAEDWEIIP
jgi:hypothetical protein